jgi:molecular chaperone HtpG
METEATNRSETAEVRPFEADVAKLLHMMVHSVYSDKDVFLRELISNAADACERLRYEVASKPELTVDDTKGQIKITLNAEQSRLTVEDNGIGMSRDELVSSLGTIARSGTKAFMERIEATHGKEGANLIGQFGVGFYSAFMVADRVVVTSRQAGASEAWRWESDGKGTFSVGKADLEAAPRRGTRIELHLVQDAKKYTDKFTIERLVKSHSGHVPVPIAVIEKPGGQPKEISDGAALWTKPKSEITAEEYKDFYRTVAGAFDDPALTIHYRAEGRHEFTSLLFVPSSQPFDLFDPDRKGRIKLYVKRVFIADDAEILPRYLRFVRGLVDSADIPLNVSREMVQESPVLAAIKKNVTARVVSELEKLADSDASTYDKIWTAFGSVLKEGIYEDLERRASLLGLARFKTTAGSSRTLKEYVASLKENQTAIYYITGDDVARIENSPHLEGFKARDIEVLLLSDAVDSFWVTSAPDFEGKPFKSVTQGAAELAQIRPANDKETSTPEVSSDVATFVAFVKSTLGDAVQDVRLSDRLTESAVCLVASESGPDRQLERLLAGSGRISSVSKPILEINPSHELVRSLAGLLPSEEDFKTDAAFLLLDEARILDGDRPADPYDFSRRFGRLVARGLKKVH